MCLLKVPLGPLSNCNCNLQELFVERPTLSSQNCYVFAVSRLVSMLRYRVSYILIEISSYEWFPIYVCMCEKQKKKQVSLKTSWTLWEKVLLDFWCLSWTTIIIIVYKLVSIRHFVRHLYSCVSNWKIISEEGFNEQKNNAYIFLKREGTENQDFSGLCSNPMSCLIVV